MEERTVSIPMSAVICATRHIVGFHECVKLKDFGKFGEVCKDCPVHQLNGEVHGFDWDGTLAPIFDAAGIHPCLVMDKNEEKIALANGLLNLIHSTKQVLELEDQGIL